MEKVLQKEDLKIVDQNDIVYGRKVIKNYSTQIELSEVSKTKIITAAGELIRNILDYAEKGRMLIEIIEDGKRKGVRVTIKDQGPGIANIEEALRDGFSSKGSLGLGLPGAKRLVNEFEIKSDKKKGTEIRLVQWKK